MEGGWAVNPASAMAKKVRFLPPAPFKIFKAHTAIIIKITLW